MKLTTNKHKISIIISVLFINAFANAQALICDTIPIWPDVKIILCREQHFLKFKNTDVQGGYFWTFYDTINKSNIVIKRSTWNLIPPKYAKDIITNKIDACDTTVIFGTYLNTNTSETNNFKQKIYSSFEISYWDVSDSLKNTYDSIINSISTFQTKNLIDTIRYDASGDITYVHCANNPLKFVDPDGQNPRIYVETNGLGHVFVTTGDGKNTTVYTYGRYADVDKNKSIARQTSPTGQGVLIIYQGDDAAKYIKDQIRNNNAEIFEFTKAVDSDVDTHYMNLFKNNSKVFQSKKITNDSRAKVVDEYNLFINNCTTTSIKAIKAGGGDISGFENNISPLGLSKSLTDKIIWDNIKSIFGYDREIIRVSQQKILKGLNNETE